MPTALVTGVLGQDGYYLTRLLLRQGCRVVGLDRERDPSFAAALPEEERRSFSFRTFDLVASRGLGELLADAGPDEIYHLAAQSDVPRSFEQPLETLEVNALGTARLLEAVRRSAPAARLFHAASADLFGDPAESPQNESTPFRPVTPYGCAKLCAYHLVVTYRLSHGLFASNGILYNHESPRRPERFVTRKITRAAARIKAGRQETLALGDLDAVRDWGYAGDTVEAMRACLRAPEPCDVVIGTGRGRRVRDFLDLAFGRLGLDWRGCVTVDPRFVRPPESRPKVADPSRAREVLGWTPSTSFEELVRLMTDADWEEEAG